MKQNFFHRIGNNLEKIRKKKEIIKDKYWKLSASERIDYDNKYNKKIPLFYLTFGLLKIMFFVMIFFVFFNVLFQVTITSAKTIIICFFSLIPYVLILDIFILVLGTHYQNKRVIELNKRFKLIK